VVVVVVSRWEIVGSRWDSSRNDPVRQPDQGV
jgi:hypothetical protein